MGTVIIVTGVNAKDNQDDDYKVADIFAEVTGHNRKDIIVFNPERYFDRSAFDKISEFVLRLGQVAIKLRFGFDIGFLEKARDKTGDVWLYLNPFFKRTHNLINKEFEELLEEHPDADIYAHSLGAVIAYKVLRKTKKDIFINLITLGSPLWMKSVRKFLDVKGVPDTVENWQNFYSSQDLIAYKPTPMELMQDCYKFQYDTETSHGFEDYLQTIVNINGLANDQT